MTVEGIDIGDIAILITLVLGMLAIVVVLLWQTGRSDAKIDDLRGEFSRRLSEVELAQARQEGVNSVLQDQTHTHENSDD